MSTSPPPTILAAICVVDSSLALAVEWAKIFSDYLTPVNQRLAELTSSANQVIFRRASQSLATLLTLSYSSGLVSSHMDSHLLALRPFSASGSSSRLL